MRLPVATLTAVMARMGRATIYMSCLALMLVCLLVIGGLGCVPGDNKGASLAVGIVMVIQTLINMIGVGPVCYPLVAETPSGKLRYKTIVIGRVVYNITGIFNNTVTPRMLQDWNWAAKSAFFYVSKDAENADDRPGQTSSASSGAGSACPRQRTGRSARSTCSS